MSALSVFSGLGGRNGRKAQAHVDEGKNTGGVFDDEQTITLLKPPKKMDLHDTDPLNININIQNRKLTALFRIIQTLSTNQAKIILKTNH